MVNVQHETESGQALVWTALFAAFVLLPLMTLVVDAPRLWSISLRVQTAIDAACEDAAVSSVDYAHYQQTGEVRFLPTGTIYAIAQSTFATVLADRAQKNFSASLTVSPNFNAGVVRCSSSVNVPLFFGQPSVSFMRESESSIRFISR